MADNPWAMGPSGLGGMGGGGGGAPVNIALLVQASQATTQAINALTVAVNTKFPDWVTVPASASASGTAGQVAYDSSFFYVCISTNTWKRVAIATW